MTAKVSEGRKLSEKERTYHEFLSSLEAWQIHKLHTLDELQIHDDYVEGRMELVEIFLLVCVKNEEMKYSVKV